MINEPKHDEFDDDRDDALNGARNADREDQRMAELFRMIGLAGRVDQADDDTLPVDRDVLSRIREQSIASLSKSHPLPNSPRPRSRSMHFMIATFAAVGATAASLLWALLFSFVEEGDRSFGAALRKTSEANVVELEVVQSGGPQKAWIDNKQQRLRIEEAAGAYKIVKGDKQWQVDEAANRATSGVSQYFATKALGFPLLSLLMVPGDVGWDQLIQSAPVQQIDRGGKLCNYYRYSYPFEARTITIEAWVDTETNLLHEIQSANVQNGRIEPLSTIRLVAAQESVDEELFVVGKTLTEDGRIGKVTDLQGLVLIKPKNQQRWTPAVGMGLVYPGDWVRTDIRGANAVAIRLVNQVNMTLGPGTQIELAKPDEIRLLAGELQVKGDESASITLVGPNGYSEKLSRGIYRLQDDQVVTVEKVPQWLAGFEGTTNNESLGSLIAKVDGRDVPLTVGYHKVTVDIRDQIARTVIEESFVNHTNGRLEGQFYFPLPQDASISGFGMWIGSELVEADIVEKQRAREIYETILRERRDPGLLEWTGGNIFKARVFPIEGNSEKRIKISYTQVLPKKGNQFRYSYGLQSELLKLHPLRELQIDVKLSSSQPLASVLSPTHTMARVDHTAQSAHVEYAAQEITPDCDFEVVVDLADNPSHLAMVPHRRGDDGYFMLMMSPPEGADQWRRDMIPDGKPLNLLILADTSGSMDRASRESQSSLIAAILSSLGPEDRFNLATCDVGSQWLFTESMPAESANVIAAREKLAQRRSLGWTDLEQALKSALDKVKPQTHVIYVGDGVVTANDGNVNAFLNRWEQLIAGRPLPIHAISVSSSFDSAVMKSLASRGGSMRQVSGTASPAAIAGELLSELTRPTLQNMKVEFRGIQTARVYPSELPNVPTGSQQIVLGRYLPTANDQRGEAVVTGTLDGQPVTYRTDVTLQNVDEASVAVEDSSFIPRLWARMHLDALLQQGSSQAIQDEIIALSEDYHIMTPYTSLLVLESDEDRERFKVQRKFQMRDAERFFAQGRDNVDYELMQKQMQLAGSWRQGLRRQVLAEFATLGRVNLTQPVPMDQWNGMASNFGMSMSTMGGMGGGGGMSAGSYLSSDRLSRLNRSDFFFKSGDLQSSLAPSESQSESESFDLAKELESKEERQLGLDLDQNGRLELSEELSQVGDDLSRLDLIEGKKKLDVAAKPSNRPASLAINGSISWAESDFFDDSGLVSGPASGGMFFGRSFGGRGQAQLAARSRAGDKSRAYQGKLSFGQSLAYNAMPPVSTYWISTLFPPLPDSPAAPTTNSVKETEVKLWSEDAKSLVQALVRKDLIERIEGGLLVDRKTDAMDVRWNELASRSLMTEVVSKTKWATHSRGIGSQTVVSWCDNQSRAVFNVEFLLGRQRSATALDLANPPLGWSGHMLVSLSESYAKYSAQIEDKGDGIKLLKLTHESDPGLEHHYWIDPTKNVVQRFESSRDGKVQSGVRYSELIEVAGAWWPTRLEYFDSQERTTSIVTSTIKELTADELQKAFDRVVADRKRVQFLSEPLPELANARRSIDAGKGTFTDHFVNFLHFFELQQWELAADQLNLAEKVAEVKEPVSWIRDVMLLNRRDHERLKQQLIERIQQRIAIDRISPIQDGFEEDRLYMANYLQGQASQFLAANEMLTILDQLKSIYEAQPEYVRAVKSWRELTIQRLLEQGRGPEAHALREANAKEFPRDVDAQINYASSLFSLGEYDAAYAWLEQVNVDSNRWLKAEMERLVETHEGFLENQGRWEEATEYIEKWLAMDFESASIYQRYLSLLFRLDRTEELKRVIEQWTTDGMEDARREGPARMRLQAAVSQMLGQGHGLYTNRIDERWLKLLADIVRHFGHKPQDSSLAQQIMGQGNFSSSDECRQLRREFLDDLKSRAASEEIALVQQWVSWIRANDPAVTVEDWQTIATQLKSRWMAEEDTDKKQAISAVLVSVYTIVDRFADEHLAFLREQLATANDGYRVGYAIQLFNLLITRPWNEDFENEALSLIPQMVDPKSTAGNRQFAQAQFVYQLTNAMVLKRYAATMDAVEHQENLTRLELREKQTEALKQARVGFAAKLQANKETFSAEVQSWVEAERLYLLIQAGEEFKPVTDTCLAYLDTHPTSKLDQIVEPADQDLAMQLEFEQAVQTRYWIMLANLALRKSAELSLAENLLKRIDAELEKAPKTDVAWKYFKYQLLVALDRPADLETALKAWSTEDDPLSLWRITLANLMAEQGKIKEAVGLLEAVRGSGELGPSELANLANWYLILDDRERHEQALVEKFSFVEEWQLQNWLWQQMQPWRSSSGEVPTEMNKDVLRAMGALMKKSASPQNHASVIREFYRYTRDFRILETLSDGLLGHTTGRAYPLLSAWQQVLEEVRDEATIDTLVRRLRELRTKSDSVSDKRMLNLLEAIVERRASMIENAPAPHTERALDALKAAFQGDWSTGEMPLMAELLANLGTVRQDDFATEQLRQLAELHGRAAAESNERMAIAIVYARTLWGYGQADRAIDLLETTLAEFKQSHDGLLTAESNSAITTFISYLESKRFYARGEKYLQEAMNDRLLVGQRQWLQLRLFQLYRSANEGDGEVSIGSGETLFKELQKQIQSALSTVDQNYRYQLVDEICNVYSTAFAKKIPSCQGDLLRFAKEQIPGLLRGQTNNYQSIVSRVANTLRQINGPHDAIEFIVTCIEIEPSWHRYNYQYAWYQFGYQLASWRVEAVKDRPLDAQVEQRLLQIVLKELRYDLESRQSNQRYIYDAQYSYYWSEKEGDFRQVAEAVYEERKRSGAAVQYIAEYLSRSSNHMTRAIEMLSIAHRDRILDEGGQMQLVRYLHQIERYGESVGLLESLVAMSPDNLEYRRFMMVAYHRTKRPDQLKQFLADTDAYFHDAGRWTEGAMAALASASLECELYESAIVYYEELIPLHQRTQPNRGIGNGTLSIYYSNLARSYAGIGNTAKAVDAASGAIVSWGANEQNRQNAIRSLHSVLQSSKDLDGYVNELDRQVAETGLENPIVRKAIGKVYSDKGFYKQAISQLELALEVQPNDVETHQLLVNCYEQIGDQAGVIQQLYRSVELSRRDIALVKDLGDRLHKQEQTDEAERAFTSIVEALPSESESHTMLAEIRQEQDRWDDAIMQWQHVADIRKLEPTGLLKLATAQIHQRRILEARESIRRLRSTDWAARFSNIDYEIRQLEQQLEQAAK